MTRKIISGLLALTMLLTIIPVWAEDTQQINILHYTDFEDVGKGEISSLNWFQIVKKGNYKIEGVVSKEKNGNYVQMTPSYDGGGSYIAKNNVAWSENFILEISIDAREHKNCRIYLFEMKNTKNEFIQILRLNDKGQLLDGSGSVIENNFHTNGFTKIAVAVDLENGKYDVYVNNRRKASNIALTGGKGQTITTLRIGTDQITEGVTTKLCIDDFAIYTSSDGKPVIGKSLSEVGNVTANTFEDGYLYVMGANKMMRQGYVVDFDNIESLAPQVLNGIPYIPLRYSVEMLGGEVKWNKTTNRAEVTYKGKNILAVPNENAVFCGDSLLINAYDFAEFIDKNVWYDDGLGMLFISDRESGPDIYEKFDLLAEALGELVFERPTGEEVIANVVKNHPNKAHPRLMMTESDFISLREKINNNEYLAEIYDGLIEIADRIITEEPYEYKIFNSQLMTQSWNANRRMLILGMAYNMTKDEKYAQRAWKEVESFCLEWQDWYPAHFLSTGHAAFAAAIAYDWFYNYWTDEQKNVIENAIVERGIKETQKCYDKHENGVATWLDYQNNYSFQCSGLVSMAALAICDEKDEYWKICADMIEYAIPEMEASTKIYLPDGGYSEATSYWDLGTLHLVFTLDAFRTAVGSDYGYSKIPSLKKTAYFNLDMMGPGGTFNFSDCAHDFKVTPTAYYFSKTYNDPTLQALTRSYLEQIDLSNHFYAPILMWYNPDLEGKETEERTFNYYRNVETVSIKDGSDLNSGNFIGLHAGENGISHYHLDSGSFIFDMNGKRFAMDHGQGTYNEANSSYHRYRYSAQGHNTWVINPDNTMTQSVTSMSKITAYDSNKYEGYAITDLTDAYAGKLDYIQRGIFSTEDNSVFLVQDELRSKNPVEAYWQMHTEAEIEILEGGKQAILTIDGDKVLATLLTDNDAVFEVHASLPYEGTPDLTAQVSDSDAHTQKLIIHFNNLKDERVAVEFRHFFNGEDLPTEHLEVVPMAEWKLGEIKPEWTEASPYITSISINGKKFEEFDSQKKNYKITMDSKELEDVKIEATTENGEDAQIIIPDMYPGNIVIIASNGVKKTAYSIFAVPIYDFNKFTDSEQLEITDVIAAAEPQPENHRMNTIDGNYNTRWSVQGNSEIIYDLGVEHKVDYITLAYYAGDTRKSYFTLYTSVDGEKWIKNGDGETTGTSLNDEKFGVGAKKARYIKVEVTGTSESRKGWNSITEFKAFGKIYK